MLIFAHFALYAWKNCSAAVIFLEIIIHTPKLIKKGVSRQRIITQEATSRPYLLISSTPVITSQQVGAWVPPPALPDTLPAAVPSAYYSQTPIYSPITVISDNTLTVRRSAFDCVWVYVEARGQVVSILDLLVMRKSFCKCWKKPLLNSCKLYFVVVFLFVCIYE